MGKASDRTEKAMRKLIKKVQQESGVSQWKEQDDTHSDPTLEPSRAKARNKTAKELAEDLEVERLFKDMARREF